MERISVTRENREELLLPVTRNTIRTIPTLIDKRPAVGKTITRYRLITGKEITGCIVSRLTMNTAPLLFLLAVGEIEEEGHRIGTRGTYYHDLATREGGFLYFGIAITTERTVTHYPDLITEGFELRGERGGALYLKLELKGSVETIRENDEDIPVLKSERFFFFYGHEITIRGTTYHDTAGFSIQGRQEWDGAKQYTVSIRRKETGTNDFEAMRDDITAEMRFENPDEYEPGYKAGFTVTMLKLVYEGEESYPDNTGIWGRDFRYRGYGKLGIRVYTKEKDI